MTLRGRPVTCEIFKKTFIDRFFPREMSEAKVVEFINLHQGGMSFHDFILKFVKLSKFGPSLVSDPRDAMSHFVTGVSDDSQEQCHSVMLHDKMNFFRLMMNARRVEECRDKRKDRDTRKATSFNGGDIKKRLEIQYKPRFKKKFSNQVPSKFPKAPDDRMPKPIAQKGKSGHSPNEKPTYSECGKMDLVLGYLGLTNSLVVGRLQTRCEIALTRR